MLGTDEMRCVPPPDAAADRSAVSWSGRSPVLSPAIAAGNNRAAPGSATAPLHAQTPRMSHVPARPHPHRLSEPAAPVRYTPQLASASLLHAHISAGFTVVFSNLSKFISLPKDALFHVNKTTKRKSTTSGARSARTQSRAAGVRLVLRDAPAA